MDRCEERAEFQEEARCARTDLEELEQQELFTAVLGEPKEREDHALYDLLRLVGHLAPTHDEEQAGEVLGTSLEEVEELLIQLELPLRALVQCDDGEWVICRGENRVAALMSQTGLTLATGPLDLIKSDLVLDEKCNLRVEVVDVGVKLLILSDGPDDLFTQPFDIDLFLIVEIGVAEQVREVLDGAHGDIDAASQLAILFGLLAGPEDRLDLDNFVDVVVVLRTRPGQGDQPDWSIYSREEGARKRFA